MANISQVFFFLAKQTLPYAPYDKAFSNMKSSIDTFYFVLGIDTLSMRGLQSSIIDGSLGHEWKLHPWTSSESLSLSSIPIEF